MLPSVALWRSTGERPTFAAPSLVEGAARVREPAHVVQDADGTVGLAFGGAALQADQLNGVPTWPLLATLPPLYPEWLGDRSFAQVHGCRFPYVTGAMANGIATVDLVVAAGRAGFLGFFGAAGLGLRRVEVAIDRLRAELGDEHAWGSNLIHSPNEPQLEEAVADLYVRRGVRRVSAAAYMGLTPAVVRVALAGIHEGPDGSIIRPRAVFAKISRPEVARRFLEPAPAEILDALVARGDLTPDEARLARHVPVAEDVTVESDSGGHTDNRPLGALLPVIAGLRDRVARERGYSRPIRVGAAGGLGTPSAIAAAFALGAAYVVTGSVNQACIESGLSDEGRAMLAQADLADVVMAPAADMFELGVEVQVLRRGTMFGVRARKLYDLYRAWPSWDDVPADERGRCERSILRESFEDAWISTRAWWAERDPSEAARGDADPHHRMALVFRSYLGLSSRWAIAGELSRRQDFQIWCGPAMGAFNEWTRGSFLAEPAQRTVAQVGLNLLEGAAVVTRAQQLRTYGAPVPSPAFDFRPRPLI